MLGCNRVNLIVKGIRHYGVEVSEFHSDGIPAMMTTIGNDEDDICHYNFKKKTSLRVNELA